MPPETVRTSSFAGRFLSVSAWGWGQLLLPPSFLPSSLTLILFYSFLSSLSLHFQRFCSVPGLFLKKKIVINTHNIQFTILTFLSVNLETLSTFVGNHHHYSFPGIFQHSKLKLCTHYTINPCAPISPAPGKLYSTFCLCEFTCSR